MIEFSVLSTLPKLVEKRMESKLCESFKHILIDQQHGFRKFKFIETSLIVFYSNLIDIVKLSNTTVLMQFTQISKSLLQLY